MSLDNPPPPAPVSLHVPLALLALSIAVFLAAQIGSVHAADKVLRWQLTTLDKQIENAKNAQTQQEELIKTRDDLVKQATQVQTQYTSLLNDVLALSETDEDAKKVVQKWRIQRNTPPSTQPAAGESAPDAPKP